MTVNLLAGGPAGQELKRLSQEGRVGPNDTMQEQLPPGGGKRLLRGPFMPRKVPHPQTQVIHYREQPIPATPI